MISAMPAVAVRREREKNRQGKLVTDVFSRGPGYIPGHLPYHHHHHPYSKPATSSSTSVRYHDPTDMVYEEKRRLRFLIYTGTACLVIGLICLFIGVATTKLSTQVIGLIFIGLGGLFCIIKVILSEKTGLNSNNNNNAYVPKTGGAATESGQGKGVSSQNRKVKSSDGHGKNGRHSDNSDRSSDNRGPFIQIKVEQPSDSSVTT